MICYYTYLPSKTIMVKFLRPCSIPNVSLSMLLYLYSALVRLLLANVMGLRMVLSGAISLGMIYHLQVVTCWHQVLFCFEIEGFGFIVEFHAYISLY